MQGQVQNYATLTKRVKLHEKKFVSKLKSMQSKTLSKYLWNVLRFSFHKNNFFVGNKIVLDSKSAQWPSLCLCLCLCLSLCLSVTLSLTLSLSISLSLYLSFSLSLSLYLSISLSISLSFSLSLSLLLSLSLSLSLFLSLYIMLEQKLN